MGSSPIELDAWMVAWVDWIHASPQPARRFASMDERTRCLVAIWVVDGQIANGGIAQARLNVPWMIDDAITCLRAIGDEVGASALESNDEATWSSRADASGLDACLRAATRDLPRPDARD